MSDDQAESAPESAPAASTPESAPKSAPASQAPASAPPSGATSSGRGARSRRREVSLADGGRLVLNRDRSIEHHRADGTVVERWEPTDPAWAAHALRFGLRPQDPTANPHSRRIQATKPPGW